MPRQGGREINTKGCADRVQTWLGNVVRSSHSLSRITTSLGLYFQATAIQEPKNGLQTDAQWRIELVANQSVCLPPELTAFL